MLKISDEEIHSKQFETSQKTDGIHPETGRLPAWSEGHINAHSLGTRYVCSVTRLPAFSRRHLWHCRGFLVRRSPE